MKLYLVSRKDLSGIGGSSVIIYWWRLGKLPLFGRSVLGSFLEFPSLLTKWLACSEKLQVLSIEEPIIKLKLDTKFKMLDSNQQQSIDSFRHTVQNVVAEANGELRNELAAQRILLETTQKRRFATDEEEYIRRQRQLDEDSNFALLNELEFATMEERREEIPEAHKTTFSWVFRDSETAEPSGNVVNAGRPRTNFAHWLRQGEKIYWIKGKAGSGKSTLMR